MNIVIDYSLTYAKKYAIFKLKGDDVMTSISITKARANLYQTVSDVNEYSEPITITNNRGKNAVLVSEDDWLAIQETLYLNSIPGMTQSMSRIAKCIDNGPMEGFWGILKRERYYGNRFTVRDSLVKMIEDYIEYYNTRRLQRKLGILTPFEKHEQYLAAA